MNIYAHKNYKMLMIVPLIVLILAAIAAMNVKMGIDFKGGVLMTAPLNSSADAAALTSDISAAFDLEDLSVRVTSEISPGLFIQFSGEKSLLRAQALLEQKSYAEVISVCKTFTGDLGLEGEESYIADAYFRKARESFKNRLTTFVSQKLGIPEDHFSIRDIGPSLGAFFWSQGQTAIIFAFVLIVLLVLFFFKVPVVCFAVAQSAFYDTFLGYAAMGALGIPFSMATIAPLLMLIGYSVDSDIMLTDRVINRHEGTPAERAMGAMKTALTMTGTTIAALTALFVISWLVSMEILTNISIILIIGLIGDIIATWFTNAVIVVWYKNREGRARR